MLTIFTPAYNRAGTLPRLFESLLRQSSRDFEWLIIDDGSQDDTQAVAEKFVKAAQFSVRYYKKENGGKHTAYNTALELAQGQWFLCVDSDDLLADQAVEMILKTAEKLGGKQGIIAYKQDLSGNLLSGEFPTGLDTVGINELVLNYGCGGEFTLIFPTALAKKYPFPVFDGERFVTESVIYDRLDPVCKMRLLRETVTVCEYQADGYSQNINGIIARNPKGYSVYFMQRIDVYPSLKQKMTTAGKYWCFRWMGGKPPVRYSGKHRILTGLCLPLGMIFRVYYKFVRGF